MGGFNHCLVEKGMMLIILQEFPQPFIYAFEERKPRRTFSHFSPVIVEWFKKTSHKKSLLIFAPTIKKYATER